MWDVGTYQGTMRQLTASAKEGAKTILSSKLFCDVSKTHKRNKFNLKIKSNQPEMI